MEFSKIEEEVFRPGNLVHGTVISQDKWISLVQNGIKPFSTLPSHKFGHQTSALRKDRTAICMMILSERPLPDRYKTSDHHGPEGYIVDNIAVILSRERILTDFLPGELSAVCESFNSRSYSFNPNQFKYNSGSVYDIPINIEKGAYWNEVRLRSKRRGKSVSLPLKYWDGIVVDERLLYRLTDWTNNANLSVPIPVFNPNCKQILDKLTES